MSSTVCLVCECIGVVASAVGGSHTIGACFGLPVLPLECFRYRAARIPATANAKMVAIAANPSNTGLTADISELPIQNYETHNILSFKIYLKIPIFIYEDEKKNLFYVLNFFFCTINWNDV